jgi:hypothetical protein
LTWGCWRLLSISKQNHFYPVIEGA